MSLPPLPGMGATTKAENYDKITAWANAVGALALNALPIKGALGGTHLDTLTGPTHVGIYQQNSSANTVDKGYPEQTACSVEILPVGLSSGVIQRVTTSTAVPRVYVRRYEGSAFTGWQFLPSLRVEETVGRAFYTYDHINKREQLDATSDSGLWRIELNPEVQYNGIVDFQRKGYDVTAEINISGLIAGQTSWNGTLVSIPAGFAPTNIYYKDTFRTSTGILLDIGQVDGKITITGAGTGTSGVLRCRIGWPVTAAWPATPPPGNQVGSVPWQ